MIACQDPIRACSRGLDKFSGICYAIDMNKEELQRMRSEGLTYQAIATQMGVSRQRIHQLITGYKSPEVVPQYIRRRIPEHQRKHYVPYRIQRNFVKTVVLTHYGNGKLACIKCGFNNINALSIDHINGGGCQHRRSVHIHSIYDWLIEHNFPRGYQTLCMNCQWIKKFERKEFAGRVSL